MGLCLSICDIGVIMEGAGGWGLVDQSHIFRFYYGTQRYSDHFYFLCEM